MNSSLTKGSCPAALVGGADEAAELAATLSSAGAHDARTVIWITVPQRRGELAKDSL